MTDSLKTMTIGLLLATASFASGTASAQAQELSQQHIDWCIARHPSYDAPTDIYDTGSSGIQKYCSSPYN